MTTNHTPTPAHETAIFELGRRMRAELREDGELSDVDHHVTMVEQAFGVRFTEAQIRKAVQS